MKTIKISIFVILISLISFYCSDKKPELNQGNWRGVILLDKNEPTFLLPFDFTFEKSTGGKYKITVFNADEKISSEEITLLNDSMFIKMPVFKDEIKAKLINKDSLVGEYFHYGSKSKYGMPFYASAKNTGRFPDANKPPALDITGRWETVFQKGEPDEYKAVGEFKQQGNKLTGTFLTSSGDYRYLEGAVSGNDVMLSCLDGAHSLLFKANISSQGNLENGVLIGGPAWKEKWQAARNEKAELPDPEKQSAIKEGTQEINFSFKDINDKQVSLNDDKYKGKAMIVQLMGSWCPNCMDETRLFIQLYDTYKPKGLEILGLCFESKDSAESIKRIIRFVNQLNAKYDFLYAGEVGNKPVLEVLPFMKEFKGYPTTLFLDKSHKVVSVYTGFSGPGTGMHYEKQKNDLILIIEKILGTNQPQTTAEKN